MQKKILLLLCFLMVRFGIPANTKFHDVNVITATAGANESGYHAFFYAMRFLKRFESKTNFSGNPSDMSSDISSFENTWTADRTTGDGRISTNDAYQNFVHQSKLMMGFFRGGTGGTLELTLDEMVLVLVYGTAGAADFYETSKRLVFAESIAEFGGKLSSMPADKHGAGVVKAEAKWIALGFVKDSTYNKSHIINMSDYKLSQTDQQYLSDAIESIAASSAPVLGGASATGGGSSATGGMGATGASRGASSSLGGATAGEDVMTEALASFSKDVPTLLRRLKARDPATLEKFTAFAKYFATKKLAMGRHANMIGLARFPPEAASLKRDLYAVGLDNYNQTCYQNALMQAIHKCTPLRQLLRGGFEELPDKDKALLPSFIAEFFSILDFLDDISRSTHRPEDFCLAVQKQILRDDKSKGVVDPTTGMPTIKSHNSDGTDNYEYDQIPQFPLGTQADASEFLQILWGRLEDCGVIPKDTLLNADEVAVPGMNNDGFHGIELDRKLVCAGCNFEWKQERRNYTYSLTLPIPVDGAQVFSISELIAHYQREETFAADELVTCPRCKKRVGGCRSSDEFFIHDQQPFMTLHLKRNDFDRANGLQIKLNNAVTFPSDGIVKIQDSGGKNHTFKVTAVVIHSGPTMNVGHYWTVTPEGIYEDDNVGLDNGAAMRELLSTGKHSYDPWGDSEGYLYFLERVAPAASPGGAAVGGGVAAADPFPEIDASTLATPKGAQALVDAMNKFIADRQGMSAEKREALDKIVKAAQAQSKTIAKAGTGTKDKKDKTIALKKLKLNHDSFLTSIKDIRD